MRSEHEMVAYALEADPALLPYLPELLSDLDELGSDAEQICEVLADLQLPQSARVVDLGCGKGAVAVEIAGELGLNVVGIELFEPFIASCEQRAQEEGLADRCRFVHGDILKLAGKVEPSDVAIFAALGDVLGRLDETIAVIRQYVKPGGYMLISDVFLRDGGSSNFPGFEQYAPHAQTIAQLTACGDTLVLEAREADGDPHDNYPRPGAGEGTAVKADAETDSSAGTLLDEEAEDEGKLITARATAIAAAHPEVAESVMQFAHSQSAENEYIAQNLIGAVWVLERT